MLLLFSDIHADLEQADALVARSRAADVVIAAGDFANVHRSLQDTINVFKAIDKPTVLVPGNNETLDDLRAACRSWASAVVLHGDGCEIAGRQYFGIGGGIPVTPFGAWSFDFSEEQAASMLKDMPTNAILVSHSPPKGYCDRSSTGRSLGSTSILAAIAQKNPALVVCGHIHGSGGQMTVLGETTIINAGPEGVEYDLENGETQSC